MLWTPRSSPCGAPALQVATYWWFLLSQSSNTKSQLSSLRYACDLESMLTTSKLLSHVALNFASRGHVHCYDFYAREVCCAPCGATGGFVVQGRAVEPTGWHGAAGA